VRPSALALFAGALALILPLAVATGLFDPVWTGRYALLALEAAVGAPILLSLLRTPAGNAALAGIAFAVWALVSMALSPDRSIAWWGLFGWGTGALFVLAVVGMWAIGKASGDSGPALIERALLVAVTVNAAVAIVQTVVDLSSFDLGLVERRAPGLLGNPVYLAMLLAGGVWLIARRSADPVALTVVVALVAAVALELSGSRFGLAVAALGPVVLLLSDRRRAVMLAVSLALGVALGAGVGHVASGDTVTNRSGSEVASGIRPRVETWLSTRHAITRDPLFGHGPGTFRASTSRYRTLRMARSEGADTLFADGHNGLVEYTVTTGIPGAVLLLVWLGLVLKGAGWREPLAGFGLAVLVLHLVEPQQVAMTPLALLALGAARPLVPAPAPILPFPLRATMMLAGLGTAGLLLIGTWHLRQASLDFGVAEARQARQLLPAWPETSEELAVTLIFEGKSTHRPALIQQALRWRRNAIRRDPTYPRLRSQLADAEVGLGRLTSARVEYLQALRYNPWSARALNGLATVALAEHKAAEATTFLSRSLEAAPNQPAVRDQLRRLKASDQGP
jgi:hypothetical protein